MFFVCDSEPLLLIYDQKPEVLKLDILLKESVCSVYDICLSASHVFQRLFKLFSCLKTADDLNGHRKTAEALNCSLVMLVGKDCCRAQKCYLFIVKNTFHCRAHGDFRLSVSNVTAKKPIHRNRRLHILFDLIDRISPLQIYNVTTVNCI